MLVSIQSNLILSVNNRVKYLGGGGVGGGVGGGCGLRARGFLLNSQIPLSVTKVLCRASLNGWLLSLEFKVYLKKFIPSPEM